MRKLGILTAIVVAAALTAPALAKPTKPAAKAVKGDETGFAAMHDWRKEGGRICYTDHTHYGNSAGHVNKKTAEAAAIKSWQEFTAWEYGTTWASFAKAASRTMTCKGTGPGTWGCETSARPCK